MGSTRAVHKIIDLRLPTLRSRTRTNRWSTWITDRARLDQFVLASRPDYEWNVAA